MKCFICVTDFLEYVLNRQTCECFFPRIQPNLDTRKKQMEAWCALVLDYHRNNKSYSIDVTEIQASPLFYNKKLNRILFKNDFK